MAIERRRIPRQRPSVQDHRTTRINASNRERRTSQIRTPTHVNRLPLIKFECREYKVTPNNSHQRGRGGFGILIPVEQIDVTALIKTY